MPWGYQKTHREDFFSFHSLFSFMLLVSFQFPILHKISILPFCLTHPRECFKSRNPAFYEQSPSFPTTSQPDHHRSACWNFSRQISLRPSWPRPPGQPSRWCSATSGRRRPRWTGALPCASGWAARAAASWCCFWRPCARPPRCRPCTRLCRAAGARGVRCPALAVGRVCWARSAACPSALRVLLSCLCKRTRGHLSRWRKKHRRSRWSTRPSSRRSCSGPMHKWCFVESRVLRSRCTCSRSFSTRRFALCSVWPWISRLQPLRRQWWNTGTRKVRVSLMPSPFLTLLDKKQLVRCFPNAESRNRRRE